MANTRSAPRTVDAVALPATGFGLGLGAIGGRYDRVQRAVGRADRRRRLHRRTSPATAPGWRTTCWPRPGGLPAARARVGADLRRQLRQTGPLQHPGRGGSGPALRAGERCASRRAGDDSPGSSSWRRRRGSAECKLRRSPADEGAPLRFDVPRVRDWLSFAPERTHAMTTTLIAGVVADSARGPLAAHLRPHGPTERLFGHFHAAVFSYHPLPQRTVELDDLVRGSLRQSPAPRRRSPPVGRPRGRRRAGERARSRCRLGRTHHPVRLSPARESPDRGGDDRPHPRTARPSASSSAIGSTTPSTSPRTARSALGAAVVAALLVRGAPPVPATVVATMAGVGAGVVTGLLHTRLLVSALLAGVLTSTALYSVSLFVMQGRERLPASSETVVTAAERLGRRFLGLPASVTLFGTSVSGSRLAALALMTLLAGALALALGLFLRTDLGMAMRAAGNNPQMARSVAIDVDRMVVAGLALSNGCVAMAGALFAQYEGFANIQMGIGAVVTGLAMLLRGGDAARPPHADTIAGGRRGRNGGLPADRRGRDPRRAQPQRAQAGHRGPGAGRAGAAAAGSPGATSAHDGRGGSVESEVALRLERVSHVFHRARPTKCEPWTRWTWS